MAITINFSDRADWWRRLINLPTAFHLWCAEQELRIADTRTLSPPLRRARRRNLGLLRAYRARGEFPQNNHKLTRFAPCFVDTACRQCAVAHLMCATGAQEAAFKVKHEANYAQIVDMRIPELNTW